MKETIINIAVSECRNRDCDYLFIAYTDTNLLIIEVNDPDELYNTFKKYDNGIFKLLVADNRNPAAIDIAYKDRDFIIESITAWG